MTDLGWFILGVFAASFFYAALVVLTDGETRIRRLPPKPRKPARGLPRARNPPLRPLAEEPGGPHARAGDASVENIIRRLKG